MLEERTFYFSEAQRGEVYAGLPEAGSEGWQDEFDMRIDTILRRVGVDVAAVTYCGVPEGPVWVIRVLVHLASEDDAGG